MFKNNRILTAAICTAAALAGTYSTTSLAATANGAASAVVTAPLTLAPNAAMDFGKFTPGASGGTITVGTGGTITGVTSTVVATGGTPAAATFDITGEAALTYAISFGAGTLSDGTNTMAVTPNADTSTGTTSGSLQTFAVGAVLSVGAGQAAGTYTTGLAGGAPFTVTVNYN